MFPRLISLLALIGFTSLASAVDVTLKDGRTFSDYRVLSVAGDTITFAYKGGIAKVPHALLPEDLLAQLQPRIDAAQAAATPAPPSRESAGPDLAALRRRADRWLGNSDDVKLRGVPGEIYPYVQALLAAGERETAEPYLARLLKAFPWDLEHQLTYGEILAHKGQPEALTRRAEQALRYAENTSTLRRAYALAGQPVPAPPPELSRTGIADAPIVLLQLGDVSEFWLYDLRDALSAQLGVDIKVATLSMDLGPANRNLRKSIITELRRRFLAAWNQDPGFGTFVQQEAKVSKHTLMADDDAVIRVMKLLLRDHGDAVLRQLDQELDLLGHAALQWDASRIMLGLIRELQDYSKRRRVFIAVTDHDLYVEPHNYIFGLGSEYSIALVSAARFAARTTRETPRRERLVNRLTKQTLSAYAQLLGIDRCMNPECIRSYPSSLVDLDASGDRFCGECRARVELALGRTLPDGAP